VLLNACRCSSPASSEWLSAGLVEIDADYREFLEKFDVHLVVVGSYDLYLHSAAALTAGPLCAVTIEPYSQEQVAVLLSPTTDQVDSPDRFSFDPEAVGAIYKHTIGDKYFTNLLAAAAITAARGNTKSTESVRVGKETVNLTAGLLAQGLLVEDRVTRLFRAAFEKEHSLAVAIAYLTVAGSKAWHRLPKDVRSHLFQTGIVGPAPSPAEATRTAGERRIQDLFSIRNPLMQTFAESLLYWEATRGTIGPIPVPASSGPAASTTASERAAAAPHANATHQVNVTLDSFQVGETRYRLRHTMHGLFSPETNTYRVADIDFIIGQGGTLTTSQSDWQTQFHVQFQTLFSKLASEMSSKDKEIMDKLQELIDLDEHRKAVQVTGRQIGTVERILPFPVVLCWEDGSREEATIEMLPPDFITYGVGQRFEAIVARELLTHRMCRILHSQRLTPLPALTPKEVNKLWNSLPTTLSLPETDWGFESVPEAPVLPASGKRGHSKRS
jgi:hypothetical protein